MYLCEVVSESFPFLDGDPRIVYISEPMSRWVASERLLGPYSPYTSYNGEYWRSHGTVVFLPVETLVILEIGGVDRSRRSHNCSEERLVLSVRLPSCSSFLFIVCTPVGMQVKSDVTCNMCTV